MTSGQSRPLAFVTATKLEHFKDKRVIQRVRQAVMRDYRYKISSGPCPSSSSSSSSPSTSASRDASASSQDQQPILSPDTTTRAQARRMPPPAAPPIQSVDRPLRRDSRASSADGQPPNSSTFAPSPSSEACVTSPDGGIAIHPMIRTTTNQQALFELADTLNRRGGDVSTTTDHGSTNFDAIMAPGGAIMAEKMQFIAAFTRRVDHATATTDPFARSAPLPHTVDLDRLKVNCATYFGSQGMADLWLPLMLASPQTFLASLCISAPYTDLMTAAQDRPEPASYTDTRQTLEILDIVPRMISDSISEHGDCDANITAVVQLLFGQLSTPYTALVASHQVALKSMVTSRGGLHALGGNGVLAMNVSLINMEANILRSEAADPIYIDWCTEYLAKNSDFKNPSPEGPLFVLPDGLRNIATSPLCSPETLELIILMQDLTDNVIELRHLQQAAKLKPSEKTHDGTDRETMVRSRIGVISARVHDMPQCWRVSRDGQPDWIYEAVRLSCLLFCHAVCSRQPLHRKAACALGPACRATPEMVQDVLRLTPLRTIWDHLAGVLYWVLMISSAACHTDHDEARDDEVEPLPSDVGGGPEPSEYANRSPPFRWPSMTRVDSIDTATSGRPPSPNFFAAVDAYSAGKRMFHEYVQERDADRVSDATRDLNLAAPPRQPQDSGGKKTRAIPLFLRDSGFVTPSSSSSSTDNGATVTTTTTTNADAGVVSSNCAKRRRRSGRERRTMTTTTMSGERCSSVVVDDAADDDDGEGSSPSTSTSTPPSSRQSGKDKRSYVRRYLTANAVRVSVLLRFEHTTALVTSVRRLEEVSRWLNGL